MEAEMLTGDWERPEALSMRYLYADGRWQLHSRIGSSQERKYIFRDGIMFTYSKIDDTVVQEPYNNWLGPMSTALEFAKDQTQWGLAQTRSERIEEGEPGTNTFRLILERSADDYRTEIVVDRATNLPRASTTQVRYEPDQGLSTIRIRYRFGMDLAPEVFDPKGFGLTIVDLPQELAKFLREVPTVAAWPNLDIHMVQQSQDGTLFVLWSSPWTPSRSLEARDALGGKYLHVQTLEPAGSWGDTNVRQMLGEPDRYFRLSRFVPIEPIRSSGKVTLSLNERSSPPPLAIRPEPVESKPSFSTMFLLDSPLRQGDNYVAKARADWYREHGEAEAELRWRREQVRIGRAYGYGFARRAAPDLAQCLRALGRHVEAERVLVELGAKDPVQTP
jgi:hypothetical protein